MILISTSTTTRVRFDGVDFANYFYPMFFNIGLKMRSTRFSVTLVLIVSILLPEFVFARGGNSFLRFLYDRGGMLIHWYRVGASSLSNNYVGTQTLTVAGNSIVSGHCPSGYSTPPYSRSAPPQKLPFAATELRRFGGYSQLHMPRARTPVYLSQGTTSLWELLTQQLSGQQGRYNSVSNPLFNAGAPQEVVQHSLENPAHYFNSANSPDSKNLITDETLLVTGVDNIPYPVCNIQQTSPSHSGTVACTRDGIGRRSFIQFTPMTGILNSHFYEGIGFINTDDGLYMFLTSLLRGSSFSCKPKDDSSGSRNNTDDDPDGPPKKFCGQLVTPSPPLQFVY